MQRVLGAEHRSTLLATFYLGSSFTWQERWPEAERTLRQLLPVARRVVGEFHFITLATRYVLACAAAVRGERACAIDYLRQGLEGGFFNARQREDGTIVVGWEATLEDPHLASLHGDPDFEAIVRDGGYPGVLWQAAQLDQVRNSDQVKQMVREALDRGVCYPGWITTIHPKLKALERDPEFRAILTGTQDVPAPRCKDEPS